MALLAIANKPDQYLGKLWTLAEDILLRLIINEHNATDFSISTANAIYTRAWRAALENNEIIQMLIFLQRDFLPPQVTDYAEKVKLLLHNELIQEALNQTIMSDALRIDLETFSKMSVELKNCLLYFLENSSELDLPDRIRLQWAALLLDSFEQDADLHQRCARQFLQALAKGRPIDEFILFPAGPGKKAP